MKNLIYAQSGGATAVINVTARALLMEARQHPEQIGRVYAANGGITGILTERIFDLTDASDADILSVENEPGAFFGTCRYKLGDPNQKDAQYQRIYEIFKAHNIGYFCYNGGNDSQDTTNRIAAFCRNQGLDITCIGIPKTVDNDLAGTDSCPGFGSVAKYISVAVNEVYADLLSICGSSTKVFIMETMGRDAGWIAASASLAKQGPNDPPHIILLPEVAFDAKKFLAKVQHYVETLGCCLIVASEGIKDEHGDYLTASQQVIDDFGHQQLGGVAPLLAEIIKKDLGYKYHWALPDYMQRAGKHLVSKMDYDQAAAVGSEAVRQALAGARDVMVGIERLSDSPYKWQMTTSPLEDVAEKTKLIPASYIAEDGFGLTPESRAYFAPLIQGEVYPEYADGLPKPATLVKQEIPKKLDTFDI